MIRFKYRGKIPPGCQYVIFGQSVWPGGGTGRKTVVSCHKKLSTARAELKKWRKLEKSGVLSNPMGIVRGRRYSIYNVASGKKAK